MTPCDIHQFIELRRELESQPRLCGYYIIKLADVRDLRSQGKTLEEIAEEVFQAFDDKKWPPKERRPDSQTWQDNVVNRHQAKSLVVEALVGGPAKGHVKPTVLPEKAVEYFDRFDQLFDEPKQYFVGLGLGNPEYTFSEGAGIISRNLAGVLVVVEGD
jgi:hypothetical protein